MTLEQIRQFDEHATLLKQHIDHCEAKMKHENEHGNEESRMQASDSLTLAYELLQDHYTCLQTQVYKF
jgi:hypothetical protein